MSPSRSHARRKRRKKSSTLVYAARWLAILLASLYLTWSLFVPGSAGALGRAVQEGLLAAMGFSSYLLPLLLFYGLLWYFRTEDAKGLITLAFGAVLCLSSASLLLGDLGAILARPGWGGIAGDAAAAFCAGSLGRAATALVAVALGLLGLQILFEISWFQLVRRVLKVLGEDYRGWIKSRGELTDMIADAAKKLPRPAPLPTIEPIPAPAKSGGAPPEERSAPAPETSAAAIPPILEPEPAAKKKNSRKRKDDGGAAQPSGKPYELPPLELLTAKVPGAPTGRPSDEEIRDAVANLQSTLASFEIGASVSGISPGPVITRYEVSPSKGVTVSSIVARSNDIALAMKARGIRMIAPIPGKAAIGIEIPNPRPATVTMREVLESPAMAQEKAPLAFALGLSSEGIPLSADLQTMPHILVAGATNSGKSVMVHSLIGSILFRQRPEQVKFLLIDPKRIELTLYDGIPHLYDPKTPPEEVQVLTHAKKAAGALKALVRVMEKRYEKFQEYKVRDIRGFNREAARRGEPGEFFIVVVIDELADLMVVARDVVEDSIQRLTQMARAVGIHMVIATQRPSVDVLTGVIKANLPSRIAMRVASKVDSKVIIDGNGAEALLGRGDALYMTPGQDPARIQGCFVSTGEIGKLVKHLRSQAVPDYPLLDTMTNAVGEADLSQFGVDALEFTQAMKLVLERRRVSQDLLKSQFGSSARATNLLSLLEVKGFIHKPEGSNRWSIHFDKIEDHLRTHYPQVLGGK